MGNHQEYEPWSGLAPYKGIQAVVNASLDKVVCLHACGSSSWPTSLRAFFLRPFFNIRYKLPKRECLIESDAKIGLIPGGGWWTLVFTSYSPTWCHKFYSHPCSSDGRGKFGSDLASNL